MSSDLSINCRTRQWVFSSQPSTSFNVQNDTNLTNDHSKSMSPVSQLASQFSNQNIDGSTPRRRLSLDSTPSDSDTSTVTPERITSCPVNFELNLHPATPETQSNLGLSACAQEESCYQSLSAVRQCPITSDYASLTEHEDLRSPFNLASSPTPSSVFEPEDENTTDSHDSGFSTDSNINKKPCGPTDFAMPLGLPPKQRTKAEISVYESTPMDDCGFCDDFEEPPVCSETETFSALMTKPLCVSNLSSNCDPTPKRPVPRSVVITPVRSLRDVTNSRASLQQASPPPQRKSGLTLLQAGVPNFSNLGGRKRPKQPSPDTRCFATVNSSNPGVALPKRRKNSDGDEKSPFTRLKVKKATRRSQLHKCFSESAVGSLESQNLHECFDNTNLVGDLSRTHTLPLEEHPDPKVNDLKCISAHTLSTVLNGQRSVDCNRLHLIDCRYPYEFDGGHIEGAENHHDEKTVVRKFFHSSDHDKDSFDTDEILVFYCEYSQQRGPRMFRNLRARDRKTNPYPKLHYPEIYLLDGGYKNFFENYPELCYPRGHTRMADKKYSTELRKFKKSKSFAGFTPDPTRGRPGLQRGLFKT